MLSSQEQTPREIQIASRRPGGSPEAGHDENSDDRRNHRWLSSVGLWEECSRRHIGGRVSGFSGIRNRTLARYVR